jgi:hypothetical protein
MLHAVAFLGAIVWFGLNGLLWYAKPSELVWLAGSALLGVIFFSGFFLYLALRDRRTNAQIETKTPEDSSSRKSFPTGGIKAGQPEN